MRCCARQMGLFPAFMLQTNVIDCFIDSSDCGYSALPPTIIALRVSELPLAPKPADGFPAGSLALPSPDVLWGMLFDRGDPSTHKH